MMDRKKARSCAGAVGTLAPQAHVLNTCLWGAAEARPE